MLIFSPKARHLIDRAVSNFTEPSRAAIWRAWADANPRVRRSGEPWDDGGPPLPDDVVDTALLALDRMENSFTRRKEMPNVSEDEASDLDNDLSHLHAVQRFLIRGRVLWRERVRATL
jgi:hypothetical protein